MGAPGYDEARRPAISNFQHFRPQAIAYCTNAADVAATLAQARQAGLPVAIRSGGHCFAGRSSTDGIVIDVGPMSAVAVEGRTATVGAGTRLAGLYDALDGHGVTLPAGCGPTVGIAGLALGGGIGILGRAHGLTCDRLRAAEIVLADGSLVRCDAQEHPDLFWALRGAGGGQFGVVTTLEFDLLPAPMATMFHLVWPQAHAAAVIDAWQRWAPDAPDEVSASLHVGADVHVFGAMLDGRAATQRQLDALVDRAAAGPATAELAHLPCREVKRRLVGRGAAEPLGDRHARSGFFRRLLPADSIAELVRTRPADAVLDFAPWGGAYNRVAVDATAFPHREERFMVTYVVGDRSELAQAWPVIDGFGSGGVYPNFPDLDLPDPWRAYHGPNLERLLHVKATYDPDGFFAFPQSLRSHDHEQSVPR